MPAEAGYRKGEDLFGYVSQKIKTGEFDHHGAGLYLHYGQPDSCQLYPERQSVPQRHWLAEKVFRESVEL